MSQLVSIPLPTVATAKIERRSQHWAWSLWLVLLLAVSGLILAGNRKTVTPSYRGAAVKWLRGETLYSTTGAGFIYLPSAALAFAPFTLLPTVLGEIAWRVLTIGCYAWALWQACRLLRRETGQELFLLATLVTLPLCWSSARNGQSTLPMTGLMLLGAVAAADGRWWRSASWLTLAVALKPLAVVALLLLGGVHRPLRWRLPLAVAALAALPFLLQTPSYVSRQYVECWQMLRIASEVGLEANWAQPFAAFELFGLATPRHVQTAIRILAAALTLGLAIYARRVWPVAQAAVWNFSLAVCYIMLLNPRTENNTYSCLAPAIGLAFAVACRQGRGLLATGNAVLALGIISGWSIGKVLAPTVPPVWFTPLCGMAFAAVTVCQVLRGPKQFTAAPQEDEAQLVTLRRAA